MKKGSSNSNTQMKAGGLSIVEAVLSVAMLGLFIATFVGAVIYGQGSIVSGELRTQGLFLAQEGLEALRNIRDNDPLELVEGTYGLTFSESYWAFEGNEDSHDIFTRQIEITAPEDGLYEIASTVSWEEYERTKTVSLVTYLADWR